MLIKFSLIACGASPGAVHGLRKRRRWLVGDVMNISTSFDVRTYDTAAFLRKLVFLCIAFSLFLQVFRLIMLYEEGDAVADLGGGVIGTFSTLHLHQSSSWSLW